MKEQKRNKEFDKLIIEAIQKSFSLYAWKSLDGVIKKCEMKIKAMRNELNEYEIEVTDKAGNELKDLMGGDKLINFYIPEQSVSFQAKFFQQLEGKRFKVVIPEDYTFFERRKHERITPSKSGYLTFEHNKLMYKKPIFDISVGGLAILLPKNDRMGVLKHKVFESVLIEVGGKKMKAKIECVQTFSIDRFEFEHMPYGGFKIAFVFRGMNADDREQLLEYITTESILSKKLKGA